LSARIPKGRMLHKFGLRAPRLGGNHLLGRGWNELLKIHSESEGSMHQIWLLGSDSSSMEVASYLGLTPKKLPIVL